MGHPLVSMTRIVRIARVLIVQNPAEYLRNLPLEVIAPNHQIA